MPENAWIECMSADGEDVCLYGFLGESNEYDILTNHKATVFSYSKEGIEVWRKTLESPERFQYGSSETGICVAASDIYLDGIWNLFLCSINRDGSTRSMTNVNGLEGAFARGVFETENGLVKVLGATNTQLFMFDLTY